MPHSLIIHLFPQQNMPVESTKGNKLHGLLFNLISQLDPQKAAILHNESAKVFTASHLFYPHDQNTTISAGTNCRVRYTLLQDDLLSLFYQAFLDQHPKLHLDNVEIAVTNLQTSGTPLEWSCSQSYEALYQNAPDQHEITIRFFSPTAFKIGKKNSLFPSPERLFQSWLDRWCLFSGIPISLNLPELTNDFLYVAKYELKTRSIKYTMSPFVGFLGECTYQLSDKLPEQTVRELNLLANFSYYCGTGIKTTMGMGQTACIHQGQAPSWKD